MAEVLKLMEVDVSKRNIFKTIIAKQGDVKSRFLKVRLTNEGTPIDIDMNSTVVINAERNDGEKNAFKGSVDSDGTVLVPLATWMLAVGGNLICSITVVDAEDRKLTSTSFDIYVEIAEYLGEDVAEDDGYDVLVQLISEVNDTVKDVETVVAKAEQATSDAHTATNAANEATNSFNESAERVENAVKSIESANVTATFDAERAIVAKTASEEAAARAEAAEDAMMEEAQIIEAQIALKADNLFFNTEDGKLYLTSDGEPIGDGVIVATSGGGGGGGSSNNAVLTLTNTTGWLSKTVSQDAECVLAGNWSSLEDDAATGNGVLTIRVGGTVRQTTDIAQGNFTVNITPYLSVGANTVKVSVADVYGNSRTINFTISVVALLLTSAFDASVPYSGIIHYTYVPKGSVSKTVHFVLDGEEIGTAVVAVSDRQQSYILNAQSHGSHIFEVYFTAEIDGQTVSSNRLYYDLICIEEGNTTPIIATTYNRDTIAQYDNIIIPYIVYNPSSLTASVSLAINGTVITSLEVDRTEQLWTYRADTAETLSLTITCENAIKSIVCTVTETNIDAVAETENLELYLTSYGRSNNELNPESWSYEDISCHFAGYNWKSDGWQHDGQGLTVHRVSGDARLTIPLPIFGSDFRTTGKTIELEFATRDVLDYDATIISCFSGGRGLMLTAQKALLKSGQSEISTQYKEDEHIRLTVVVEKRVENRLIYLYLNGIMCGATQYPADDDFSQPTPVNITVGSNLCTVDLYNIRVYNNNLTRHQILENWIADTQSIDDKLSRYARNNVYDAYGSIVIEALPKDLPHMVIVSPTLPMYKGNKLSIDGYYNDLENSNNSFTFADAQIDVQGTSSAGYARKNYKIKFRNGFNVGGTVIDNYKLRADSIPTNTFTFKADVASSESANNVQLVRLYNAICPYKTPPQLINSAVRQGIDGYPTVIFHDDNNDIVFIGKYNFNNDKGTPEVYGFADGDESWEIRNNTSNRVLFKSGDFSGDDWLNDFEARYPEDNTDCTNLAAFVAWVASTDQTTATNEELAEAITYDGTEYTHDTADYRLAKFKAEFSEYAELDSAVFYYLFTELFLMVDSRAKNAFPSKIGGDKFCWLPYDMDTAMGINNEGALVFGYELEDTDVTDAGATIFNGQDSVIWTNLRQAFASEIKSMYQTLRSDNAISYQIVEKAFEEHQGKWAEAIWNEDAYYKYLQPLIDDNTSAYLSMLQGSKSEQRKWWLYNRFRYIDSKYNAGDALSDFVTLRGYAVADITVEPYADVYASIRYGSYLVQERALRGKSYTLACPLDNLNDTEIYIYSASQLKSIGDLSPLKVGYADFSKATKLTSLKLGDASEEYSNGNLTELYLGNNSLLQTLDARNCPNLGKGASQQTIDLTGCTNIENIYFDGTSISGVTLPNGGIIKVLHLPSTITNLTIINQPVITEFEIPDTSNITTLRLENVSAVVDGTALLRALPAASRVRLIGINWTYETPEDVLLAYNHLDTMRGLDENGNNTDKVQISGTIHVPALTGAQLKEMQTRYPNIDVTYNHITTIITYYNGDTLLASATVYDGADAVYSGSTPTKTATAQYTYTFSGWSLTNGGSADANALKAVTADRTVYAAFTETVRTYIVRFYNGTKLLQTVYYVPYGGSATYTGDTPVNEDDPEKEFYAWAPYPTNITNNTNCYAVFHNYELLNNDTWEEIAAYSAAGTAANRYTIGDCKQIVFKSRHTWSYPTDTTYYVYIIGFNHNSGLEGNGITFGIFKTNQYNGTSILLANPNAIRNQIQTTYDYREYSMSEHYNGTTPGVGLGETNVGGWQSCSMRYKWLGSVDVPGAQNAGSTTATSPVANTIMADLPSDLRAVMKPITKYTDNAGGGTDNATSVTTTVDYLPLLSEFEVLGVTKYANSNEQLYQAQYVYYAAGNSTNKVYWNITIPSWDSYDSVYWSRSPANTSTTNFIAIYYTSHPMNAKKAIGVSPIFKV